MCFMNFVIRQNVAVASLTSILSELNTRGSNVPRSVSLEECSRALAVLASRPETLPVDDESTRARCVSSGLAPGCCSRNRARDPATNGAAWDVPLALLLESKHQVIYAGAHSILRGIACHDGQERRGFKTLPRCRRRSMPQRSRIPEQRHRRTVRSCCRFLRGQEFGRRGQ